MRPRPDQRFLAADGPAVLAAAAVFALAMACSGPVSAQSPSGWKRGGGGSPESVPAGRPLPVELAPERTEFFSNLGLLDVLSREAVVSIVDSLKLPPGSTVTLLSRTPHEANWFVGNILGETLAARGYEVRIQGWETAPASGGAAASPPPSSPPAVPPRQPRNGGEQNPASPGDAKDGAESTAGGDLFEDGSTDDADSADGSTGDAASADGSAGEAASTEGVPEIPDSMRVEADSMPTPPEPAAPARPPVEGARPGERPPSPGGGAPAGSTAAAMQALPEGDVLDLRVVEFGVSYSDVGRKLLFGPMRFTRVGGIYLQVSSLRGPEGDLRQVLSAERHRVDRLSGPQRSLAEGASYPFRIPELKAPGLGRYVEPTVVVGIVGSLVYLFYANQSSK